MSRLVTALGCLVLVAGARAAAQEPSFQGRTLTEWVGDLEHGEAPYTRHAACWAIAEIGPAAAPRAVPALVKALSDEYPIVRYAAANTLKELGPAAAEAIPALEKATKDRSDDVAFMARKALQAIKEGP